VAGPAGPQTPAAGPQPQPFGQKIGEKPLPQAEQPATAEDVAGFGQQLPSLTPGLTAGQRQAFAFPSGYTPTNKELQDQKAAAEKANELAEQAKRDQSRDAQDKLRDAVAEQNFEINRQVREQTLKDKQAADANKATVQYSNLYSQQNYADKMKQWYDSGHFAKDSGLVTGIINDAKAGGLNLGGAGDTAVGALIGGPEGALAGGAIGVLGSLIGGPTAGYLDTLKKQGISQQGYDAMQAYFNALPGRMSYELGTAGVGASAMRSSQLINKVMNTVPPPNTPKESFDSAFQQYFKPMETNVKSTVKTIAPPDFQPPKYEDYYPKAASAGQGQGGETPRIIRYDAAGNRLK